MGWSVTGFSVNERSYCYGLVYFLLYFFFVGRPDDASDPLEKPFAFGLTIRQLSAQSTDGDWRPQFVSQTDTDVMHKIWRLKDFSLYLDSDIEILVDPFALNDPKPPAADDDSQGQSL